MQHRLIVITISLPPIATVKSYLLAKIISIMCVAINCLSTQPSLFLTTVKLYLLSPSLTTIVSLNCLVICLLSPKFSPIVKATYSNKAPKTFTITTQLPEHFSHTIPKTH